MSENASVNDGLEKVSDLYKKYYLEYASYVILDRAVPAILDGLKPVQRRILTTMFKMNDGRFHKVASIVGETMKLHPHGDSAITDALVQIAQRDLLIEMQGNFGDPVTGDRAAASRYIEARLSKFALEVLFNPKTTLFQDSYDARAKEPIVLPAKFPIALVQGIEGIAVGLACKIFPHNFIELIDASIAALRKEDFELYPDFPTGGIADVAEYNEGLRGGRVRVRAKIDTLKKRELAIREIPFGTTTASLIDSIVNARDKGKIKFERIEDHTAENVEILIQLSPGMDAGTMINALYAFTDCETSLAPNSSIIENNRPEFLPVKELLKRSAKHTRELLKLELEIELGELQEKWHLSSLEKIFIENRIYRDIEECTTWEGVMEAIRKGLKPFLHLLRRAVTDDDIVRLTEIKIKRISRYDAFRADEFICGLEDRMKEIQRDLKQLTKFTIHFFESLKQRYGAGRERKTELASFDRVDATKVAVANETLYVNYKDGFVGTGMKKDEAVLKCSILDDIIVFTRDGNMRVVKVADKVFVGKDIIHVSVFDKDDKSVYSIMYRDGKRGSLYAKRFLIGGITREKEYSLTKGNDDSRVFFFSVDKTEQESPFVKVYHKPVPRLRKLEIPFNFAEFAVKNRGSQGNIITKNIVLRVARAATEENSNVEETGDDSEQGTLDLDS
ncbi:MAG: DNA gyrase/topoisomerase IV subunit A [Verrucomicrobia bacterium]|nr:DNA gyrase/topoisomerase IV subunit A [Verrucomicrobiota bacterium]MDA1065354.1 DNA gyrase/topoisomerase IV subunit A [Verrucomicrobiota bacterium]